MNLTVRPSATSPSTRTTQLRVGWSYLQHELLYLSWALMDVALLTPLALALMGWARYWPPGLFMLWLLLIMLLAFNLGRLMSALHIRTSHQQTVMALALFLVMIVSLRTLLHTPQSLFDFQWLGLFFRHLSERGNLLWLRDVLIFLCVIICWTRGLQMINRTYSVARVGLRLRVGGLLIMPLVLWLAYYRLLWSPSLFVLLFFLAGLTAVAIMRAEELEKELSGYSAALAPRWLIMVLAASGGAIFIAGVITLILSGQTAGDLFGFLSPVWLAVEFTLAAALTTLLYLFFPLLELLDSMVNGLSTFLAAVWAWGSAQLLLLGKIASKWARYDRTPVEQLPQSTETTPIDTGTILDGLAEVGITLSRNNQIILVLLSIAIILLVALVLGRLYQQTAVAQRTTAPIHPPDNPDDAPEGWLPSLLHRLGFWQQWQTAVSIRRIYRHMLHAAAAAGYPRLESETPYEYLHTLGKAWPQHTAEARLITQAYVQIRYGQFPETAAELAAIRQAWQTLEQTKPSEHLADNP
jgi:hypothetical protein